MSQNSILAVLEHRTVFLVAIQLEHRTVILVVIQMEQRIVLLVVSQLGHKKNYFGGDFNWDTENPYFGW